MNRTSDVSYLTLTLHCNKVGYEIRDNWYDGQKELLTHLNLL